MKTKGFSTCRSVTVLIGCAVSLLAGCGPCDAIYCFPALADAGGKASDLAGFLAVERADEMVAGNATLGESGPLGRKGGVSLDLRANRTSRTMPAADGISVRSDGETAASDFLTSKGSATSLTVDVALPLWQGLPSGASHIGGIDVIGSLTVLQGFPNNSLHVTGNNLAAGGGIRLGLLEETPTLPGISYTGSLRFIPSIEFRSDPMPVVGGGLMTIAGDTLHTRVASWRLAASKRFGRMGLTAGVGGDTYDVSGGISATLSLPNAVGNSGSQYTEFSAHRRNLFVGGSYTVSGATIVGEFGHLSSASNTIVGATNTFGGQTAEASRSYLSLGVRIAM